MKQIALAFLCSIPFFAYGQPATYGEVLTQYHAEHEFNGVALVATDGEIDFLKSIGTSDRTFGVAMSTGTRFKIASMTKAFTAVLVMQLVESGKIDLDATFGEYFPTYRGEAKDKVTMRNLLTYSSGLPDAADSLGMQTYQLPLTLDAYIDKYCSATLVTVPGTESVYSNTEYILLQKIVENVTGRPFATVLQENILAPLRMDNTGILSSTDIIVDLADSYTIDDSTRQVRADEPYYIDNFFASGAMYSTAEDILKFDRGIFDNRLLNPDNTALLIAPNKDLGNVAFGVWYAGGYGIFDKPFIYRTGGIQGATANWIHTIGDKRSIILLSNTNGTNLFEMSSKLYAITKAPEVMNPTRQ